MNQRKAGQKIAAEFGKNVNGSDAITKVILAGAAAGLGATQLMSIIDLFTGEARADNSGEVVINPALSLVPLATGALGAAAASDPVSRELLNMTIQDVNYAQAVHSDAPGQDKRIDEAKQGVYSSIEDFKSRVNEEVRKQQSNSKDVIRQSGRRIGRGTGIGVIAGAIPAMMLMRDTPAQQQEVI